MLRSSISQAPPKKPATTFEEMFREDPSARTEPESPPPSPPPSRGLLSFLRTPTSASSIGVQAAAAEQSEPVRQPKKLVKPRRAGQEVASTPPNHWRGIVGQEPPQSWPSAALYEQDEATFVGSALSATRDDELYHEKHFGNTYTAGWTRLCSRLRNTLSWALTPICPSRFQSRLDSVLTATLGPSDISARELLDAVHAARREPSSFLTPLSPDKDRGTWSALERAAASPTAIEQFIDTYALHNLQYLEEVADRHPGQVGSWVRSRIRHSVNTRLNRALWIDTTVSVAQQVAGLANRWTPFVRSLDKANPSAGDYLAHLRRAADTLENTGRSNLVSEVMTPYAPSVRKARQRQARREDTKEWERLSSITGVPMRVISAIGAIPSCAKSWLSWKSRTS